MRIIRSIAAVVAGLVFIVVSHSVTDRILEGLGIFTPPEAGFHTTWMVVTATLYRTVFSIAGCYLAAALAPDRPMLHSMVLGLIGFVASGIAAIVIIPMDIAPAWYPIALTVLSPVSGWLGGWLYGLRGGGQQTVRS